MRPDFSAPQKQSGIGVLVMFSDTVQKFSRALWSILAVSIFQFRNVATGYLLAGLAVLFAIIAVVAYLRYVNFTFYVEAENDEFIVTEGILNKTKTAIQLHKIQQVNIKQNLLQRIIGVFSLDVDTAGSQKKEVSILAISHQTALDLKSLLLENEGKTLHRETEPETLSAAAASPFVRISFASLLKIGITSNYVRSFLLLLAFFFSTYENLKHIFTDKEIDEDAIGNYVDRNSSLQLVGVLLLLLFGVVLVMNIVRIVFRYFGYSVTRQSGSLLLSYGLLNTRSTIVKPEKVQVTTVSQNYFQKKMDILQIRIKQATGDEKEERKSAIEIPGCSGGERDEILKLLFGAVPQKGIMLKPNFRKLGFAIFLTIVLPLCGYYTFRNYFPQAAQADYIVPVYVVFVGLVQFFKYRNNRFFIHDDFIILQSGAWDIAHDIIEPGKIQAITTSQLFWHKSLNIGSLTLHTAGGNIAFHLGNFQTIRQYVNLWLYELERTDKNWM